LAVELLEPWLAEYPEDASAWSAMAGARYRLDNLTEARVAAARAVDLRPNSARNWCNLGMILRKLGALYDAERALHRALTINSSYDRARTELRKIHELRTGDRAPITEDDFV
jgi:Flp pilus assembly protein TadD